MTTVWEIFELWKGGIVLYGSILGGTVAFLALPGLSGRSRSGRCSTRSRPALAFGIAIGRLGCFLNGCCWGDPCNLPWAVSFPKNSPAWQVEVARGLILARRRPHPPPPPDPDLFRRSTASILLALLNAYYPLRRRDGEVMGLMMLAYPGLPVPRRVSSERRGGLPRRDDHLPIHQRRRSSPPASLYWAWLSTLPRSPDHADAPVSEVEPSLAGAAT